MARNWWHANSTANNSRERRYTQLWNEDCYRKDLQAGKMSLESTPFTLANKYDISEIAAKRMLKEVRDQLAKSEPAPPSS